MYCNDKETNIKRCLIREKAPQCLTISTNFETIAYLMQWWTNFSNSCRPLWWLALVVCIFNHGAMPSIQILHILQPHNDVKHISHSNSCVWRSVKETATCLKKIAGNINVMMTKIIKATLHHKIVKRVNIPSKT